MTWWAVDIGGTKIAAARILDDGAVDGDAIQVPTPGLDGPDAVLAQVVELLSRLEPADVQGVGVSSAGVIDSLRGNVLGATDSITGWAGTDIAAHLTDAVGLPTVAVGDGHAFAIGEAVYGAAAGRRSAVVLAVGTGVGGSYIQHRTPLQGSHWAAGHFGHLPVPQAVGMTCYCGRSGHLEAIGSGAGLHRWYATNGGDPSITTARQIVERTDYDPVAAAAVALSAAAVGDAAAGLANAFDPDIVVVAGGVSRSGPSWRKPMHEAFAASLIPALSGMPIVISAADEWLALRGAVYYARQQRGGS